MRLCHLAFLSVLLAGCTMQAVPPAAPADTPPAARAAAAAPAGLLAPTNALRRAEGLPPLRPDARLDAAALAHARDMAANGFFGHRGSDGTTLSARARVPGCTWTGLAENLAGDLPAPDPVVAAWMASAGHRDNLLGPYALMGEARAGDLWVAVYGTACRTLRTVDAALPAG